MDELGREIKILRTEEEQAQQYLFAYLSISALLAERPDVVAMGQQRAIHDAALAAR